MTTNNREAFFVDLQKRLDGAKKSVAGKRPKYGTHTDAIQKIFLNLGTLAGHLAKFPSSIAPGPGSAYAANSEVVKSAMARVETVISSGGIYDLETAISDLVAAVRSAWEKAQNNSKCLSLEDRCMRLTAADKAVRDSFGAAMETPIPITDPHHPFRSGR